MEIKLGLKKFLKIKIFKNQYKLEDFEETNFK